MIKFGDSLGILKRRWKLISCITLTSVIVTSLLSFFIIKPKYESYTKLFIGKETIQSNSEYNSSDIEMYQKLMQTYSEVIKTEDLVSSALKENNILVPVDHVLDKLKVEINTNSQILEIKYRSKDAAQSNNIVQAITKVFMTRAQELIPNANVQIVQASKIAEKPVSPNKVMYIIMGFLLGCIIGVGVVLLSEYLDDSFRDKYEIEKVLGISVIGSIPVTDE